MIRYGIPGCIRSDNGSEFIAKKVKAWLRENGIRITYIEPGSPWQNSYVESLNSRLRYECLSTELFTSIGEARYVISEWQREYNLERPHSSLKRRTPAEVYQQFIKPPSLRSAGFMQRCKNEQLGGEYYH
jgi:transposase InsO family protein